MFLQTTRFREVFEVDTLLEFSSLSTRLDTLAHFPNQFSVSPIFGHFEAEVKAGPGRGYYMHSLPLSFLTHTGVVGTSLVVCIVGYSLTRRLRLSHRDHCDIMLVWLFAVIVGLGTISTFMTWSVFWFFLGLLVVRPFQNKPVEGPA